MLWNNATAVTVLLHGNIKLGQHYKCVPVVHIWHSSNVCIWKPHNGLSALPRTTVPLCITYSGQENTIDTGARSRVLFNQYRWGTLNNPASVLYSVTYASGAACPLLQAPSGGKSPSALFRCSWDKYDYNRPSDRKKRFDVCNRVWPNGIENVMTWFPATGPLEKQETALERSWRTHRPNLRRGWQFFQRFRGKRSLANLLKGTSPTCRSDWMRGVAR